MTLPLGILGSAISLPPVVTGGTLTSDATYYYRTFTANGTLTIADAPIEVTVWQIGGGGAGGIFSYIGQWTGYFSSHACYGGGGGGGGGVVKTFTMTALPAASAITVGAGASYEGNTGFPSQSALTPAPSTTYASNVGGAGYRYDGGNNSLYSAGNYQLMGDFSGADPYYIIGGGGAGAGGNGNTINGGPSVNVLGRNLGGGGSASYGGYDANDYGTGGYLYPYYPTTVGTPGTNGGTASATGAGGDGAVNTGSGGGGGKTASGKGGSGIVIIRYLRSAVGV